MNDDVFEMENAASAGLTPRSIGQPLTTTPSPTGYRDYKPPAEVLDENYGHRTMDYGNARSSLKRTKVEDSAMAHKVSSSPRICLFPERKWPARCSLNPARVASKREPSSILPENGFDGEGLRVVTQVSGDWISYRVLLMVIFEMLEIL